MASETQRQGFIVLLLLNGFFAWVCTDISYRLSGWGLWLWMPTLSIILPVLLLSPRGSVIIILVLGLMADAWSPLPVGWLLWLWLSIWLFFSLLRPTLRRENAMHIAFVVLFAQSIAFWTLTVITSDGTMRGFPFWQSNLLQWLFQSLILFFSTPLWLRAQKWTLRQWGWDVDAEIQA